MKRVRRGMGPIPLLALIAALLPLGGCAVLVEGAAQGCLSLAFDRPRDDAYILLLKGGRADTLLDYHIDGDSLFGHRPDHAFVGMPAGDALLIRKVSRSEVRRKAGAAGSAGGAPALGARRSVSALPLFLITGMALGGSVGTLIPAGETGSQPGMARFGNALGGMAVGLGLGYLAWALWMGE